MKLVDNKLFDDNFKDVDFTKITTHFQFYLLHAAAVFHWSITEFRLKRMFVKNESQSESQRSEMK